VLRATVLQTSICRLRILRVDDGRLMTRLPPTQNPSPEPPSTVIVVEPEILARMVIADYLRGCGYKVIETGSADDVFAVLRSDIKIDVLLCEVSGIGATDGFSLAKEIRKIYPTIDVVLTSGITNAAEKSHNLCEDSMMKKPYHPEDIVRQINILRERRRSSKII
jgi:DNA-binding response OmpR family regulator